MDGATPTSKPQPISSKRELPTSERNFDRSQLLVETGSVEAEPVVTLSWTRCVAWQLSVKQIQKKSQQGDIVS